MASVTDDSCKIRTIMTTRYPLGKFSQRDRRDEKSLGKRSALNAHAAFNEAGAGNTIGRLVRQHSTLPVRGLG